MSANRIIGSEFGPGQMGQRSHFLIEGHPDFGTTLTLGQVIKGRVLRHYEGSRYLVDFSGREVVVDSAVPLRSQEIIRGRVIGVGEQVKLEKMLATPGEVFQSLPGQDGSSVHHAEVPVGGLIGEIFSRYRGELDASGALVLKQSINNVSNPEKMVLSGLVLSKLGVAMAPELLRALFDTMEHERGGLFHTNSALFLDMAGKAGHSSEMTTYESLGKTIELLVEGFSEAQVSHKLEGRNVTSTENSDEDSNLNSDENQGEGASQFRGHSESTDAARWLLNVQTGGTLMHRINTIPIMLGDRLVEVDVAFLQQRDSDGHKQAIKHRQVVFALDTEQMGHVEISAVISDRHVRITVTADANEAAGQIAQYSGDLRTDLIDHGWNVDELRYETRLDVVGSGVVRTVVDHIIAQDSLMRWM